MEHSSLSLFPQFSFSDIFFFMIPFFTLFITKEEAQNRNKQYIWKYLINPNIHI